LVTASREIENYDKYDYILVNDRLEESIESLQAIVSSERLRSAGRPLSEAEKRAVDLAGRCRLSRIRERVLPIVASFASPAVSGSA
jgi:hypothetical protein